MTDLEKLKAINELNNLTGGALLNRLAFIAAAATLKETELKQLTKEMDKLNTLPDEQFFDIIEKEKKEGYEMFFHVLELAFRKG